MPGVNPPLAGETLMEYLVRTRPQYDWTDDGGTTEPHAEVIPPEYTGLPHYIVRPRLLSAEWDAYVLITWPPPPEILVPPVWPGAGAVTLGTPVGLLDQLVVDEVMDGVLVEVTTPPGKLGSYLVGGSTLDYGVGRITFETDDGDLEPWQYLGFRSAIYVPKTMEHASKARFQVLGGAEGTVTPWTRS
jgi:hypothetical protein